MLERIAAALSDYEVVLEPDENTPEWWAGAPSVCRGADGAFYLAARMREGNAPKGRRGYETRILKSADGRSFEPIHHLTREAVDIPGFERPALVVDPLSGQFRLYSCTDPGDGWSILKFDDVDNPAQFDPSSARVILAAEHPDDKDFFHVHGYKDPVVFWDNDLWHMFVIGIDRIERVHHFVSDDGEAWRAPGANPVMENAGWHNFFTRPASVVPMTVGYLFVYEGSHVTWRDPNYNIATGLAYSPDLETFIDLTPDKPLLTSTTPGDYLTWRYSQWMRVANQVYVYFEAARPNKTNEIRLGIFDAPVIE